jgi:hypothetical protein
LEWKLENEHRGIKREGKDKYCLCHLSHYREKSVLAIGTRNWKTEKTNLIITKELEGIGNCNNEAKEPGKIRGVCDALGA